MEHLLVRLLSHESYVIHMYSYVIHNKMMIKSYCNIYIYGYLVRWKSFTSNRSRSSRSSRSVASLTWPQWLSAWPRCGVTGKPCVSMRRTAIGEAARIQVWNGWICLIPHKFQQFWKVDGFLGTMSFIRVSISKIARSKWESRSPFLSTFVSMPGSSFHKVFSTTCNQVEMELAKAGLASVKWIFVVRSFPKIREKQQALLAVWSLVHWSLVRLWLAPSLLHMSPEFSDRWLLGLRRLFGFVLSQGLFNEEFNDPPCWQNMAFACPEGACTQTRPAAKNGPLLRQYVNAVRQYVQMVSFPHLPCSRLPIHHFRVHPSQLG